MKPRILWFATSLVVSVGLARLAEAAETAVEFRPIAFEAATKAATAEGKLVMIDFYTTWCEPCKRLDKETWTDASVGKLMGEKAVALKLDAEKEGRELAKRYKIDAYPTTLVLKPDGTEVDRVVGFREPAAFKLEFGKVLLLAQSGKSGLEQAKKAVVDADAEEAMPHFELAQKLARSGDSEAALKELVWCWEEGRKDPEFAVSRNSRVPSALASLARSYPPAQEAMIKFRDQARDKVLANKGGVPMAQDLIMLNQQLKEEEDSLAVFDKLPEGDRRRVNFSIYLFNILVEKQRYADALLFYRPEVALMPLERAKRPSAGTPMSEAAASSMLRYAIERASRQIEALAGAKRTDEARELMEKVLAVDGSEATKTAILKGLTRAGRPELAVGAKESNL